MALLLLAARAGAQTIPTLPFAAQQSETATTAYDGLSDSDPIPLQPVPAAYVAETITIARCTVPPKIDGRLDDRCWASATKISGFYPYAITTPIAHGNETQAWLCTDSTHLYIAFRCDETAKVAAAQTQRNEDLSKDDNVEIDIDSQYRHRGFSQFIVNAAGVQNSAIEGGTAQNITWAGDWKAAGRKTSTGYTVEIAIPFSLLRYPKGAHQFGIFLSRNFAGQNTNQSWPYNPVSVANSNVEGQYMAQATGLTLPYYAPRPTILPYTLATAGDGYSNRTGVDIKYPFSTTLTGVASFYPDLDTIEQNVESIQFSYDQKQLTDNRPFFAEGSSYLPDVDLFYSRNIGQFDQGLKIVGKDGDSSVGVLATNYTSASSQFEDALNLRQDFGPLENLGVEYVGDDQTGLSSNQVGRIYGGYTWLVPHDQYSVIGFHTQSYIGGNEESGSDSFTFQNNQGNLNQPYFSLNYQDIGPNFDSNLGYVPELDKRGTSLTYGETDVPSKGPLAAVNYEFDADQYQYHTGGFFHDDYSGDYYVQTKSGYVFVVVPELDQRDQYHDHNLSFQFQYGQNTLYQQGKISVTSGKDEGQDYNFYSWQQSIFVSTKFSSQLKISGALLGNTSTTQTILTGNYRLTPERTISFLMVNQSGTNVFISFSQLVRSGMDVFVLFGNPNAVTTVGSMTVKLAYPF